MQNKKETFWVVNISNRNVSLRDLALTIKARASVNLLDEKHYHYTLEQLQESAKAGSIYKKSNKIILRKVPPESQKQTIPIATDTAIPTRTRSVFEIKEENYDELNVSDEEFAEINADIADIQ